MKSPSHRLFFKTLRKYHKSPLLLTMITTPLPRLFCILFVCLTLFSCVQGESNVESGNRQQILHFGNGTEIQGLDPHVVTGIAEHHVVQTLFEGLVFKDSQTLEIEPAAAASWEISKDGRIYTFTMRDDARWSNGDPVTAYDFEWSWWRALQPSLGSQYVFMYFPIKNAEAFFKQEISDFSQVGIKALDAKTFRVELKNPTPYFLQLLDHYSTFPVHQATIKKFGKPGDSYTQWTRPENIVTNGPFLMNSWRLNKRLVVERNEDYWGAEDVRLNKIVFHPIDSEIVEERMFRANQLHWTDQVAIDRAPWYRKNAPERMRIKPYVGTYLYRVNNKLPHLSDVRVRKALAMTVDRDTLMDTVLNNFFTPSYAITPPGLLGYQPPKTFEYNPDRARELLAEAGYPKGEGFPEMELQYNSSDQHRKIATAIQQMWNKELNIQVRLQNKDWKVYLDDEATGNFEISRGGWIGDYVDPNTFLDMWVGGSGVNRTGWNDPKYDELILEVAPRAKTREERFAAFRQAEELMMKDMPFIPIYTYSSHHFVHPSVKGMHVNVMNYHNFREVYLDPDWEQAKPNSGQGE